MKIHLSLSAAVLLLASAFLPAQSQTADYPNKPVSIMVPYPAGGLSDVIARVINVPFAQKLSGGKQPILVENLGGAGGAIAAQKVLDPPADGYYIFQGSPNELLLSGLANKAVKFKPADFRAVHVTTSTPLAIIARSDLKANSADELVVLARQAVAAGKPLTYASVGIGTFYHLVGEDLSKRINAPMLHIPYKGGADVVKDLLGQQIDIFISPYGAPHVAMHKQGKIKMIAALSPARQPLLPDVASVNEGIALKGYHHNIWSGYFVKKGTPEPIVQKINLALNEIVSDSKLNAALVAQNMVVTQGETLAQAEKTYADGVKQFSDIAKSINLQAQ